MPGKVVGNQTYASLVKGKVVTEKEMVEKGFEAGSNDTIYYDGGGISAKEVEDRVVRKTVDSVGRHSGSNGGNNVSSSSGGSKVTNNVIHNGSFDDDDNKDDYEDVEPEPEMSIKERIDHGVSGGMRIGTAALIAGGTILTVGAGGIFIMLVAGGTMIAGGVTTTIGVAEVGEGVTGGHNFVRDDILQGNERLYNNIDQGAMLASTAGTVYCNGVNYNNQLKASTKETGKAFTRGLESVDDLDATPFRNLQDNGVVSVNSSGSNRPVQGMANSYYKTANGKHVFVYDGEGKLIYDLSSERVKAFNINVNPAGKEFYQPYKLDGSVPEFIKEIFGW